MQIVVAGRYRRTPWILDDWRRSGWKQGNRQKLAGTGRHRRAKLILNRIMNKSEKLCDEALNLSQKSCQNHEIMTIMAPKIDPKSMKNRGCVADAFLERCGVAPKRQKGDRTIPAPDPFGSHFRPKIEKMASKKKSKNRCRKSIEKWCQNDAKMISKWMPKSLMFDNFWKWTRITK